ncbi:ComF family protein [Thermosulfurimonas dismutans]|uniref:ComF family protein n=1 Tax=Thermosulfurimonas dismutans TaxID=999894 RepID=UPI000837AA73|nr:ComF family protein [Thermosulfurimonas dismutans]
MRFPKFPERILKFLFPAYCSLCGELLPFYRDLLCEGCESRLPRNSPACPVCARTYSGDSPSHPCGACLVERPFKRVVAPFRYEPPVSDWIRALKFGERFELARGLARLFRRFAGPLPEMDLVVPVPLGRKRFQARGYNQSALLARFMFGKRPLEALLRTQETPPQTELPEKERRRNVRGAFEVKSGVDLSGKRVMLVDDVMTTGATVEECARVLLRAGAAEVSVAVIARA